MTEGVPNSVPKTAALLAKGGYLASDALAASVFLALKLQRPLLLEGEAGVGKTEVAKVLATVLDRPLVRLQCYEGLDLSNAAYEWNYSLAAFAYPRLGGGRPCLRGNLGARSL